MFRRPGEALPVVTAVPGSEGTNLPLAWIVKSHGIPFSFPESDETLVLIVSSSEDTVRLPTRCELGSGLNGSTRAALHVNLAPLVQITKEC